MRVGIVTLLQESNTFAAKATGLDDFRRELLVTGFDVEAALADAHHEVAGFFSGLRAAGIQPVGLFAARALPAGVIDAESFARLLETMLNQVAAAGTLDGLLVAPHGATVSATYPDADGHWLTQLRLLVGSELPIIGTLDPHANLSPAMVEATNALVAYRTNPHVDQRERGLEAAEIMARTLSGEIHPTQAAAFLPLLFNIERQASAEWPAADILREVQLAGSATGMLSASLLYGFPYADVPEMGASVLCVADDNRSLAKQHATALADLLWRHRADVQGTFLSVNDAIDRLPELEGRICLLDMGDNIGGGSAADGTVLAEALHRARIGPSFVSLYDPQAAATAAQAGPGATISLTVGGQTDTLHGQSLPITARVRSCHDGRFRESQPRHGGLVQYDMGRTVIVETEEGLTIQLTSRRTAPWSLGQLTSCGLDPANFRILVAKGVNAPIAAYREVCQHFLRVDTPGSTSANPRRLDYHHRRHPLYPLEDTLADWRSAAPL